MTTSNSFGLLKTYFTSKNNFHSTSHRKPKPFYRNALFSLPFPFADFKCAVPVRSNPERRKLCPSLIPDLVGILKPLLPKTVYFDGLRACIMTKHGEDKKLVDFNDALQWGIEKGFCAPSSSFFEFTLIQLIVF